MSDDVAVEVTEDVLIPSEERECKETFDDLLVREPWGLTEDELLDQLSGSSPFPTQARQ